MYIRCLIRWLVAYYKNNFQKLAIINLTTLRVYLQQNGVRQCLIAIGYSLSDLNLSPITNVNNSNEKQVRKTSVFVGRDQASVETVGGHPVTSTSLIGSADELFVRRIWFSQRLWVSTSSIGNVAWAGVPSPGYKAKRIGSRPVHFGTKPALAAAILFYFIT